MMVYESKRVVVGEFFVDLTAKMYGGEIQDNGKNDSEFGNPDIIHWDKNHVYESKSSISTDHHKIRPEQMEHYRKLVDSPFPLTDGEAYYFLWQHKNRGISKFDGNDFEKRLVRGISRLLIVSLDVIEAGSNVWVTTGQNSWGEMHMFRASERTKLTKNTRSELERMGLSYRNFNIDNETVSAGSYKYKWWNLPEFLVTTVINKDYRGIERVT